MVEEDSLKVCLEGRSNETPHALARGAVLGVSELVTG